MAYINWIQRNGFLNVHQLEKQGVDEQIKVEELEQERSWQKERLRDSVFIGSVYRVIQ